MKRYLYLIALSVAIVSLWGAPDVSAESLKIKPLMYRENIDGASKRGFVDISNPSSSAVSVSTNVQGFKQINDQGALEFYDDAILTDAIQPEIKDFELGPREEIRLFFTISQQKLPKRTVYAALFARTVSRDSSQTAINQSARVGTLMELKNGGQEQTAGQFTSNTTSSLQLGDRVSGSFVFKNTASGDSASGYFPKFTATLSPSGISKIFDGRLVFPGISRANEFSFDQRNKIGVFKLTISSDGISTSKTIFVLTGYWRYVAIVFVALILLLLVSIIFLRRKHKKRQARTTPSTPPSPRKTIKIK